MAEWGVVHDDVLFDAEVFVVARLELQTPHDGVVRRQVVRHPGTVAIVAMNAHGQVALVRPYRPALGGFRWEVPAGRVEASSGIALEDEAARELAEEVGVAAKSMILVAAFMNAVGHSDQVTTVYFASQLTPVERSDASAEGSGMPVYWCDVEEARVKIASDGPPDAKSLIALQHVRERGKYSQQVDVLTSSDPVNGPGVPRPPRGGVTHPSLMCGRPTERQGSTPGGWQRTGAV